MTTDERFEQLEDNDNEVQRNSARRAKEHGVTRKEKAE